MNNTNSNKEDLKINNDEGIFYDKPQYDNEITLSRLVPVNTKGMPSQKRRQLLTVLLFCDAFSTTLCLKDNAFLIEGFEFILFHNNFTIDNDRIHRTGICRINQ